MNKLYIENQKGFTLIEVIVYVALFSIIMGGLIVSVLQISQGSQKGSEKVVIGEEINFVLKKIDWALSGWSVLNNPTSGTDNKLSVDKIDFPGNPIVIRLNSTSAKVEYCTEACSSDSDYTSLTTSNVNVETLSFEYLPSSGGTPEGLKTTITIDGITNTLTKYKR